MSNLVGNPVDILLIGMIICLRLSSSNVISSSIATSVWDDI